MVLSNLPHENDTVHAPHRNLFSPAPFTPVLYPASPSAVSTDELSDTQPRSSSAEYEYPAHFIQQLSRAIILARQEKTQGGIFIFSINNLAMVMSVYGHSGAEQVMQEIQDIIRQHVSPHDSVTRINREQIGVIAYSCNKAQMSEYATKCYTAIQGYGTTSPIGAIHVTCSIGSVDFPENVVDAVDAIDKAYIALSSTNGISYRSYDEMRDENNLNRQQMGLANYLRRAIHENRLRLAFQPVIESTTGKISHYEALLRIIGEDGKISSAGALIPIAERMGLIDIVDFLVFDMVVKELTMSSNVVLAFNVSNITTDDRHWLQHAVDTLKKHPGIAERMIVEITETAAQRDLRRTAFFVATLQAQGCQVALDDFGSGYTSLRQLKTLSVDMVKIDGAFVKDLIDNADNRFFVKTLLDFTRGFGLSAVAEYVEKGETAKLLMELGVEYMQGYYFGRPENYRSWVSTKEYTKD